MTHRRNSRARSFLWLSLALVAGCDGERWVYAKEQVQLFEQIRSTVQSDPVRVDEPIRDGKPPLHHAIWNDNRSLMRWLFERGADPNVRDTDDRPAFHEAIYVDRDPAHPILRLLLARGANLEGADRFGERALHIAASTMNVPTAEFLLDAGADPSPVSAAGETPLHRAAAHQPYHAPEQIAAMIRRLVARGADPNAHLPSGPTPLFLAAVLDHALAIETLVEQGADPNIPGAGGWTPLHIAAVYGRGGAVAALVRAGADVDRRDDRGRSPLWLARNLAAADVDTKAVIAALGAAGARALGPDPE